MIIICFDCIVIHYGKSVIWCGFLDEREHVQKKTFTKWVNSHLVRVNCKIQDLYADMRDGKMLIRLLEVLSGERLVRMIAVCKAHGGGSCLLLSLL